MSIMVNCERHHDLLTGRNAVIIPKAIRKAHSVTGQYRVLIVDDDPLVLEIAQEVLGRAGYDVGTAEDGIEGAWKFARGDWDVVIADRMMPRLSGEEMTAAIKAEAPHVPVILLTGVTKTVQHPVWYAASITKPFDAETLVDVTNDVLKRWVASSDASEN